MATRGQKIARAFGRRDDKLRSIFLSGVCLKVLSGDQQSYTTLATYDSHWYLDRRERTLDLATGKKYLPLTVEDVDGCRLEKLRKATALAVGNERDGYERFRFAVKPTFLIGALPAYEFKVVPTGERV
jgi:hypothetical protein